MAQMWVLVNYHPGNESHKIVARITDINDGRFCTECAHFRDMGQVRSYYNGWISAMGKAFGYGNKVSLDMVGWPFSIRMFTIPSNLPYLIDVTLPDDLREPEED